MADELGHLVFTPDGKAMRLVPAQVEAAADPEKIAADELKMADFVAENVKATAPASPMDGQMFDRKPPPKE